MPNGNRFYVHPGGEFGPGLMGLAESLKEAGGIRREREEKEATQRIFAEAAELYRTGDPDQIMEFAIKNPQVSEVLSRGMKFRSERTEEDYINSIFDILQDPSRAEELVGKRQEFLRSQGVGPEGSRETDAFLEQFQADPEGTKHKLEMELAFRAPEKYKQYRLARGEMKPTQDIQNIQYYQKLLNEGKPDMAKHFADLTGITPGARVLPIPTDIDDFVEDANAESIRITGKGLTPGDKNKARLQFKRAQSDEVRSNRFAEKNVDIATAEKIKYNSEIGKNLAQIATAGALLEAKGEISPQGKIDKAKGRMSGNLATLANHYIKLNSTGAMLNVDNTTFENVIAAMRASTVGQAFGRITGSNEQSIRSAIKKLKPLLIQDIRQSTDMGARGLDSVKELEFYLQAATDEKTDIQSNIAAIVVLDEAFGEGKVAAQLRNLTDESLVKRISREGNLILHRREPEKIEKPASEMTPDELRKGMYEELKKMGYGGP